MCWLRSLLATIAIASGAFAGELNYAIQGGDQLSITAKDVEQQAWKIFNGEKAPLIIVAAVVNGSLVVEEFKWPFDTQPSPTPEPEPQPGPPTPHPNSVTSLIWIEESEARQPSQAAALIDKSIREAISQRRISFRVVDVDVKDEKGETPSDLAALIDAAKSKGLPVVFGLDANGKTVLEAKVNTREDFESLLRRLGVAVVEQRKEPVGSSPPQSQSKPAQPQSSGSCASGSCPTTGRWLIRRR